MAGKKSKASRIINGLLAAFTVILMLAALFTLVFVTAARADGKTPKLFGYSFSVVITDSMTPEINEGDLVIAKECDNGEIAVGDDIVFVSRDPVLKGNKVVHRVVRINEAGEFVTKGIKEGATEDRYTVTETVGKVVGVSASAGRLLSFLNENKGTVLLVLIAAVVVVAAAETASVIIRKRDRKSVV